VRKSDAQTPTNAASLLLMSANGVQDPLTPWVVRGEPVRGKLSMIHHGRLQKARFRHRHVDVERLDFVPEGLRVPFQGELAG
jgi:hypothetical protein